MKPIENYKTELEIEKFILEMTPYTFKKRVVNHDYISIAHHCNLGRMARNKIRDVTKQSWKKLLDGSVTRAGVKNLM